MTHNLDDQLISEWAKKALNIEAEQLIRTARLIDQSFISSVRLILASKGKLVVTGLGKSGHVGRKVAATLSSTGTSAFFLHPAEALHGDLGMIGPEDIVLAIAFGGETEETLEVAKFARRCGNPIIAITGKANSSLAVLADQVLNGSIDQEACPLKLAPTSSTTVAMALGDSLAVALMGARGFAEQDFAKFHPAGSLGRKLSLVSDHMQTELLVLSPEDSFAKILEVITSRNFGIAAVVSDRKIIGAITDGDLRRALIAKDASVFSSTAEDLMSKAPKTISSTTLAVDAVRHMESSHISSLFVLDGRDNFIGIVRMYDLLSAKIV